MDAGPAARVRALLPSSQSLPAGPWHRRHRGIVRFLGATSALLALFCLVIGVPVDHMLTVAPLPAALGLIAWHAPVGRRWQAAVATLGLMAVAVVAAHETGTIEAHFVFFMMVPVMALYEDWVPFATGIAVVVLHHVAMALLDPAAVYNHPAALARPLLWSALHTVLFAGMCAASLVHWRIHEQAHLAQRELTDRVRAQALRDPLTALANRTLLMDRLGQALRTQSRREEPVAVLMLDLDGFKPVNDLHGHAVGDRLLVELAARLDEITRPGDTLARLGGDEFALALPDTDEAGALEVAARVVEAVAEPFALEDLVLTVGASVGVATSRHGSSATTLLRRADAAMYAAKRRGRGRAIAWSPGMDLDTTHGLPVDPIEARAWAAYIRDLRDQIAHRMATGHIPEQTRAPDSVRRTLELLLSGIDALPDEASAVVLATPDRHQLEEFVFHQTMVNQWADGLVEAGLLDAVRPAAAQAFWDRLYAAVIAPSQDDGVVAPA